MPEMSMSEVDASSSVVPEVAQAAPGLSSPPLPPPFHSVSPAPRLVTQGAESHLYETTYLFASQAAALKIRPSKSYRHRVLDQRLTKQRILAEARVLVKLRREGYSDVPGVYALDWIMNEARGNAAWLLMEWIPGPTLKEAMLSWERECKAKGADSGDAAEEENVRRVLRKVGVAIARLHSHGVVHGDLTSSNVMIRSNQNPLQNQKSGLVDTAAPALSGDVVLIDFGLAQQTTHDEERAVDLYVLERAFGSTHPRQEDMFEQEVLKNGYAKADQTGFNGARVVLKRLEDVRLRGRKRSMIG